MGFVSFHWNAERQGSGGQLLPRTTTSTSTAMAEPSNVCKLPLCQLHAKTAPQLFILERPFRCGDGTCGNKRGHHVPFLLEQGKPAL